MRSLLLSRRDLDFLLHEWLDVEALTKRERFAEHSRETFDAVLDLSEQVATRHFAPHNRAADLAEPRFDGERVHMIPEVGEALRVFADTGIVGAAMDAVGRRACSSRRRWRRPASSGSRRRTSQRRRTPS